MGSATDEIIGIFLHGLLGTNTAARPLGTQSQASWAALWQAVAGRTRRFL